MNYEYLWKVLEDLFVELTKKGVTVPAELLDDLKSAKTLITICNAEPTALEVATQIELYLDNVESNLLYLAESDLGKRYADKIMEKLDEARQKGLEEKVVVPSKYVSGVQKGEHWIRINISDLVSIEELYSLFKKFKLSSKTQEDGYILVHGKEEDIKAFIKEIGGKIREKKR